MLVWKSQWLSGKVTAFRVEDCGSSPGLGAEARSGEARRESPDGRSESRRRRRRRWKKVKELQRREKKCVYTVKLWIWNITSACFLLCLGRFCSTTIFLRSSAHLPNPLRFLRLPPPRFSVQAGLEPATSRPGRLSSYHWATGTFTLTLLFFAVLSFLSGQNQISHEKMQFSEQRATRAVSRLLSDPLFLDLCLFWGV